MSGGAKGSAFLAAHLARELHHIIGMLMMGCNQDMAWQRIANRRRLDFSAQQSSSAAENPNRADDE